MKNNILYISSLLLLALILISWSKSAEQPDSELLKLRDWMTGSFSSQEQSEVDTNFYDIRLEMVQIWEDDSDTIWLYVEQAISEALDKPYRQRVYRLSQKDKNSFESAIFSLEDPLRFAGVWREEAPLNGLSPDSLIERSGCTLILVFVDGKFQGSTNEKDCSSNLRGASYANSQVVVKEDELTSLDRGFDQNDEHVWGSEYGPYIFKKLQ